MSNKKELSAIDAIYDILKKIENIDKRIILLDSNVKLLNNKVSKIISGSPSVITKEATVMPVNPIVEDRTDKKEVDRLVLGNIKTFGYIVNKASRPIDGVLVTIYDDDNKIIKNTSSNLDGYWDARLPPGDYGIEYIHKNFKPINKVINLEENITTYEVR